MHLAPRSVACFALYPGLYSCEVFALKDFFCLPKSYQMCRVIASEASLANYFDPMSLAAIYGALHGAFHHGLLWSEVICAVGSGVLLDFV